MATTPNLELTHIVSSQSQKEVTANAAFDGFDGAISDSLSKTVASSDITLTDPEALQNAYFIMSGAQGANIDLFVPDFNKKFYIVDNRCTGGFTITVKYSTGSGIIVVNGDIVFLYADGTNVLQVSGAGGSTVGQLITKRVALELAGSGNNTVIAAVSAKKLRVFAYSLQAHGTVSSKLTDGAAGAQKTPLWKFQDREGVTEPNNGTMLFEGSANTALILNLSGAVTVSIAVTYTEED